MSEPDFERNYLVKELQKVNNTIRQEFARYTWGDEESFGKPQPRLHFRIHSSVISAAYATFNIIALVAGVVMILDKSILRELGIAIVVGSLFAFGSFMAQWWCVQVQFERDFYGRTYGLLERQKQLGELRTAITERLNALTQPAEGAE